MDHQFHKIRRLPPYVFEEVNAMKAQTRFSGEDIIDFGVGNPDRSPALHIIEKLREKALYPRISRYSNSRGIIGLRKAQSAHYKRRFGFDEHGDGHVGISLFENVQRIRLAIRNIKISLSTKTPDLSLKIVL